MKKVIIRQGDVALVTVSKLPEGATLAPDQEKKIVLAWGEVTGHHHRIEDHVSSVGPAAAAEMVEALIARCKAKLYEHKGDRYLVVEEPVNLTHEEHTKHTLAPGIYELPVQVEYSTEMLRRVAD